jgi:hypothetical protein
MQPRGEPVSLEKIMESQRFNESLKQCAYARDEFINHIAGMLGMEPEEIVHVPIGVVRQWMNERQKGSDHD